MAWKALKPFKPHFIPHQPGPHSRPRPWQVSFCSWIPLVWPSGLLFALPKLLCPSLHLACSFSFFIPWLSNHLHRKARAPGQHIWPLLATCQSITLLIACTALSYVFSFLACAQWSQKLCLCRSALHCQQLQTMPGISLLNDPPLQKPYEAHTIVTLTFQL